MRIVVESETMACNISRPPLLSKNDGSADGRSEAHPGEGQGGIPFGRTRAYRCGSGGDVAPRIPAAPHHRPHDPRRPPHEKTSVAAQPRALTLLASPARAAGPEDSIVRVFATL